MNDQTISKSNRLGSPFSILAIAILVVFILGIGALVYANFDGAGEALRSTVVIIAILLAVGFIGFIMVSPSKSNDLKGREKEQLVQLNVAYWAVLALTAVSFSTTYFGLNEFLQPKVSTDSFILPFFLSVGTTLGIQSLMLVMALQLGKRIMSLKPLSPVEEKNRRAQLDRKAKNRTRTVAEVFKANIVAADSWTTALGLALMISAYFISSYGLKWTVPFSEYKIDINDGFTFPVLMIGLAGLYLAIRGSSSGGGWRTLTLIFLAFVYFGCLSVSSLFSFDAYYRLMQTEENIELNRDATVIQRSGEIIAAARDELSSELVENKNELRDSSDFRALRNGLISLQRVYADNRDAVNSAVVEERERLKQNQQRLSEERQVAIDTAKGVNERIEEIKGRILTIETEISLAESGLSPLSTELTKLQTERAVQIAKQNEVRKQRDLEATGADGRDDGEGPKWREFNAQFNAIGSYIESLDEQITAATSRNGNAQNNIAELNREKAGLAQEQIGLEARAKTIDLNFDDTQPQSAALDAAQRDAIAKTEALATANPQTVGATLSGFLKSYDRGTFNAYLSECSALLGTLESIDGTNESVLAFDCQPPGLRADVERVFELASAQEAFLNECSKGVAGMEYSDALGYARNCLQVTTLNTEDFRDINNDLTQLQSEYSTSGYDLRRAIRSLEAGEQFAVGAAAGAVFIDLLILIVGIIIAMLRDSRLYGSLEDVTAEDIERDILQTAMTHDRGHDPFSAIFRFMKYMRPTGDGEFSMKLHFRDVPDEDITLVAALIEAGRPFVKPNFIGSAQEHVLEGEYELNGDKEQSHITYDIHSRFFMLLNDVTAQGVSDNRKFMANSPSAAPGGDIDDDIIPVHIPQNPFGHGRDSKTTADTVGSGQNDNVKSVSQNQNSEKSTNAEDEIVLDFQNPDGSR